MKKTLIICALAFAGVQANAQMDDISVTLQPTGSYNWFDDNTAIEDGVMVGGRIGFGFGEAVELRALYEKSIDLKNTAEDITDNQDFIEEFNSRDVDIERWGGEFKANIPTRGSFVPYVTLGAGVQKLEVDTAAVGTTESILESKQIYANLGLGTQIKISDRAFLNLEAKNTVFNMDPTNVLYQSETPYLYGDERQDKRMYNWSALAGLQFYLGGREPDAMSDLDRAYYRKFSGGLSGLKLVLEPGGSFINFNDDTNLKDTYLLGGKAGFDLNQYIGLRGFYYQATKDEEISTDWDELAIYGGDIVAKLNVSRGIVPYIELGGGYMNVYDSYTGKDEALPVATSGYFAKGGAGVTIPVSKNFEVYGSASLMYTSQRDAEDLENTVSPDELTQHNLYNVGLRLQLGRSSDTEDVLESKVDSRVNERTNLYQERINELERELEKAYDNNDTERAVEIIEEKKAIEGEKVRMYNDGESRVRLTPEELEDLVDQVIKGVDEEESSVDTTEERIDRLERLLLEVNTGGVQNQSPAVQESNSERILSELKRLNDKVDNNAQSISRLNNNNASGSDKTVIVTQPSNNTVPAGNVQPGTVVNTQPNTVTTDENGNVTTTENVEKDRGVATGMFVYEGASIFVGGAFGDDSAAVIGVRGHYAITNSAIGFMPDIYAAPGSETGFGINANALYEFDQLSTGAVVAPYLGVGVGYNAIGDWDKFGVNFIVGTSFDFWNGNLYLDYTARNFDIHQVALGYKFGF